MKKKDIIQLALIVMGIGIIFRGIVFFTQQMTFFLRFTSKLSNDILQIVGIVLILIILTILGFLIVFRSGVLAKKIVRNEDDQKINVSLGRSEIIHVSIIILCLYFLVTLFPSFLSNLYQILFQFVDNFKEFKEIFFQKIAIIILYIAIIIILSNSQRFSIWMEEKIMH